MISAAAYLDDPWKSTEIRRPSAEGAAFESSGARLAHPGGLLVINRVETKGPSPAYLGADRELSE
jgi:hypothetical protein